MTDNEINKYVVMGLKEDLRRKIHSIKILLENSLDENEKQYFEFEGSLHNLQFELLKYSTDINILESEIDKREKGIL